MKFERWVFAIAVVAIVAPTLFAHIEIADGEDNHVPQLFVEIVDDRRVQALQLTTAWHGEAGESIMFDSPHPLQVSVDDFANTMLFCSLHHNEIELYFTGTRSPSSVSAQRWHLGHSQKDYWDTGRYAIESAIGFIEGEYVAVDNNIIHVTNDRQVYLYEVSARWAGCGSSSTYAFLLIHLNADLHDELEERSILANFIDNLGWIVFYLALPFVVVGALSFAGFVLLKVLQNRGTKITQWAWLALSAPSILFLSFFFAVLVNTFLWNGGQGISHIFGVNILWLAFVLFTAILLCVANRLIAKREFSQN